jgi:hypothetical protein
MDFDSVPEGGDTVPPTVSNLSPAAGSLNASPVVFGGQASDNVGLDHVAVAVKDRTSGQWLQSDGSWGPRVYNFTAQLSGDHPQSGSWSLTEALPDGSYAYQVNAVDTAGNSLASKPFTVFTVNTEAASDTTPPEIAVDAPTNNSTVDSPVQLEGSATDNISVARAGAAIRDNSTGQYLKPDGSWGSFNFVPLTLASPGSNSTSWTGSFALPSGTYGITLSDWDEANQQSTTKPFVKVTVN